MPRRSDDINGRANQRGPLAHAEQTDGTFGRSLLVGDGPTVVGTRSINTFDCTDVDLNLCGTGVPENMNCV
jgi:hypothetical protein